MSSCGILMQNSSKDVLKTSEVKDLKCLANEVVKNSPDADLNKPKQEEKKAETPRKRIVYTKDELIELRSAPSSLKKPECLSEEFFVRNGVWDPISWHESAVSRSSSPVVEGKCVTFEHGKKIELLDDAIELAPHRRSFCKGCHVQPTSESENTEKGSLLSRRLRAGSNNESKGVTVEGKDRLTGRAASQRKNIEKAILKERENKQATDAKKVGKINQESKSNEASSDIRENKDKRRDISNARNNKNYQLDNDRNERSRNRFNEKENRYRNGYDDGDARKKLSNGSLPEWMTDGPISQTDTIELKGFNAEIEEERKALIKDQKKPNDVLPIQQERNKKSSKGNSRSSTPSEKKQRKRSKNEEKINHEVVNEKTATSNDYQKRLTPSDKLFDENGLFDVMDYLPTHLFAEDFSIEATPKSKFSSWFRSQSGSGSDHSRPNSGHLGFASSPVTPMPYFTPIQPAPATQTFERPIAVSPFMDLFTGNNKPIAPIEKPKEVKGRVTLNEIEQQIPMPIGHKPIKTENVKSSDQNAFDKLVFTMKAAGQLPEKPAPVVSGLPEHLLPKPPKKTSPCFEKLKRDLSRSPSPVNSGGRISPFSFINRSVSPLIPPMPGRLLSPEFFQQTPRPKPVGSSALFNSLTTEKPNIPSSIQLNHRASQQRAEPRRFDDGYGKDSMATARYQQTPPKLPTAFLPTSVIKKIHSNKQDHKERSDTMASNESYSNLNIGNTSMNHPPGLSTQNRRDVDSQFNMADSNKSTFEIQNTLLSSRSFENREKQESLFSTHLPQKSAPVSPHSKLPDMEDSKLYHSAPVTPLQHDLPSSQAVQRSIEPTSAFSRPVDKFGMMKSNNDNDKEINQRQQFRSDSFNSLNHQQSLLNDQRNNNDVRMKNYAPTNQQRGQISQPFTPNERPRMQLPNSQQRMQPQQQQAQRSSQTSQFNYRARANQSNAPRLPVPMNQPSTLNQNLNNRPNIPAVTAAMAAQIVQQQLLQQAARAHALQAAQAIQQQQQQNLLRTQMQAVMAQAYAREQAAKAMMYNPRAVASNLQAVAQQMGLRAPHPSNQGKGLPTPMLNQPKEGENSAAVDDKTDKTKESPLSKWFNVDVIKKTPPAPQADPSAKSKVLTLEDLEKQQQ